MDRHIIASLDRADELFADLKKEYEAALTKQNVSDRAVQLTHEVLERLRSILDRLARKYWETHVRLALSEEDQKRASIYFPIAESKHAFDSTLGRWCWKSVRSDHDELYDYLLFQQPYQSEENKWLQILNDLAVAGKHIDLVPQIRTENKVTTVSRGSGSISYSGGVRFSGGISIMGAPINPRTQRIIPTPGATDKVEKWVSFVLKDYNVNSYGFCSDAIKKTRKISGEMTSKFGL